MSARFAVIIPCFNNIETIREAVDSAISQDYGDYEIHVCDNASTDGTRELLKSYSSDKLKLAIHETVLARTDNWNRAYEAGFGADYLVTLHADDRLAPGALSAIARAARKGAGDSGPCMIHGSFRKISYVGDVIPGRRFPLSYGCTGETFQELLLLSNHVAMPGVTIRTDIFRRAGRWDPAWNYLQDMELWWKCGALGQIFYVSARLGDHREFKQQDGLHRHAEEHLRWASEKLRASTSPKLKRAAASGLDHYLRNLERELEAHPERREGLAAAINASRNALQSIDAVPHSAVLRRQRLLRALCALNPWPPSARLPPAES